MSESHTAPALSRLCGIFQSYLIPKCLLNNYIISVDFISFDILIFLWTQIFAAYAGSCLFFLISCLRVYLCLKKIFVLMQEFSKRIKSAAEKEQRSSSLEEAKISELFSGQETVEFTDFLKWKISMVRHFEKDLNLEYSA